MEKTNIEKWRDYMRDCVSPASFIDWGFYGLISCALQRRVWTGSERKPLYPNMYIILTAPPGIGKGLVISEVGKVLRYHKLDLKANSDLMYSPAPVTEENVKKGNVPLLIPIGADATTYEALVRAMSKSIRSVYHQVSETKKKLYIHSSLCFCLEEISSLFRKHTDDLVNFLLVAYDCGDYRYETISRGEDLIKSCCLNLVAGTTPGFIKRIFGDELLTDGFASRAIFVSEKESRFFRLRPPSHDQEQIKGYEDILNHVKKLAGIFGECKFTPEAEQFLESWWQTDAQTKRANTSPKLIPYYARKNITVQKLAMILHFSDNLTMEVGVDKCIIALSILDDVERRMHTALITEGKNPLTVPGDLILNSLLEKGKQTYNDLLFLHWEILPEGKKSLDKILEFLLAIRRVKVVDGKYYEAIK